ncbi:hypothetical protein C2E23DRAFT_626718 [Lenzites betulinus]|nr:hypothetical protein C2E23DRAFT_626718 [Lenzites betulinus]
MSLLPSITQPLTAHQASCWLQSLARDCMENVASLPTYILHDAERWEALDRFHLLSTHAGVFEQLLCRMCFFLPPDIVHTVVAIIAATHRQRSLLSEASGLAQGSTPFILPARTIETLTRYLTRVEARLLADARWIDSPEGRRLAEAARALAQEVRVSRDAFAQGLCTVMATAELSTIPDWDFLAQQAQREAEGTLENEDEWAPLRDFLQASAFGPSIGQEDGFMANGDSEALFPHDDSGVFVGGYSRSFGAEAEQDAESPVDTLCADSPVHRSARQLEKSVAIPDDEDVLPIHAAHPVLRPESSSASSSSTSSSTAFSASSPSPALPRTPAPSRTTPHVVIPAAPCKCTRRGARKHTRSRHKRNRNTTAYYDETDTDSTSHKKQRIYVRFPQDTASSSDATPSPEQTRPSRQGTLIHLATDLPGTPPPPQQGVYDTSSHSRPSSSRPELRIETATHPVLVSNKGDPGMNTDPDSASPTSADDGYWQKWVVYDPACEREETVVGRVERDPYPREARRPRPYCKPVGKRRCWDGVLDSVRGFFAVR